MARNCWKKEAYRKESASASSDNEVAVKATEFTTVHAYQVINSDYEWCVDSGATPHMCKNKNLFVNM